MVGIFLFAFFTKNHTLWDKNLSFSSYFILSLIPMAPYIILATLGGIWIGYLIFYLRYQYRDTVNELREHLKEANRQVQHLQEEVEELSLQNEILRDKTTELLDKNDELNDVVAELSKYYVHIKKAAEKSSELSSYLKEPDPELENKIHKQLKKEKKADSEKSFF